MNALDTGGSFVLVTRQPGAIGDNETNAYGPGPEETLTETAHLLADGAEPTMTFEVLPLRPPRWGSV